MPRTIVDIPQSELDGLERLRRQQRVTRAALIREAIAAFLAQHRAPLTKEAFGVWRDKPVDALAYQNKRRQEWPA